MRFSVVAAKALQLIAAGLFVALAFTGAGCSDDEADGIASPVSSDATAPLETERESTDTTASAEAIREALGPEAGHVEVMVEPDSASASRETDGSSRMRAVVELKSEPGQAEREAVRLLLLLNKLHPGHAVYEVSMTHPRLDGTGTRLELYWNDHSGSQEVVWGTLRRNSLVVIESHVTHPSWRANGEGRFTVYMEDVTAEQLQRIAEEGRPLDRQHPEGLGD